MKPPVFDFSSWDKQPVGLSADWPRMTQQMRAKISAILADGCSCHHDQPRTATLRRRVIVGNVNVYLQCDACGVALGSALSRREHYHWQDYPVWDDAILTQYDEARQRHYDEIKHDRQSPSLPSFDEGVAAHAARRKEYAEWCATSAEWEAMRRIILWRSRGHCEACLQREAEVVHHLTYEFGKLPPAWQLRAVCQLCHTRLHNGEDEWCADGMARDGSEDDDAPA